MSSLPAATAKETIFNQEVVTRFELYNSLFLTLPFYQVKDTGILLPFFSAHCEKGTAALQSPMEIIGSFFDKHVPGIGKEEQINRLFRFIQYIERQVVLFDAIEDASFSKLNRTDETGTLTSLIQHTSISTTNFDKVKQKLERLSLRLVLTAHPTQFYPGPVLGIITDLTEALKHNDINSINLLLQQLGKTPFLNKESPTPVDEALSLIWFLENVFYHTVAGIESRIGQEFALTDPQHQLLELGFWPGGDRDGNPNVNVDSTQTVAETLRHVIFRCYYRDFRVLKRRITFRGVEEPMQQLEALLYTNAFNPPEQPEDLQQEMLNILQSVVNTLNQNHDGLFTDVLNNFIHKVRLYGCYFATLDIRQDSRVLRKVFEYGIDRPEINTGLKSDYMTLNEDDKLYTLTFNSADFNCTQAEDAEALVKDALCTIRLMRSIQQANGEKACNRFIISNCQEASDILQLMNLFLWTGWQQDALCIDFMPLFETVNDLANAARVMETLYQHPVYQQHLKLRGNHQSIMLGFSDSTKDGGYLMANWSIYKAKVELTALAKRYSIDLAFFDGRGGPPARGGGKTHRFYAAMGKEIANEHIQLTIQGQTVSSQYGSAETARFNIEQLLNAGLISALHPEHNDLLDNRHKELLSVMAEASYDAFNQLRVHPVFTEYLENLSPLTLLSNANISSRPTKRNADGPLKLEDLRAISFVTAWSQLKQNIPGFYGMGTALQKIKQAGAWEEIKELYRKSGFFNTMIDNCMMSMSKSDFRITAYLAEDVKYGEFWRMLKDEFELSKELLLALTESEAMMQNSPVEKHSIALRERIILPLVTIQHYALALMQNAANTEIEATCKKLAIRTVYGIVNAGRNLA
ncbi:phosphoenolpyruvate carboxylase [Mucilaginibacter sp.]